MPSKHGGECKLQSVRVVEFETSGFEAALAAVVVAVGGGVAVVMVSLTTAGHESRAGQ